LPESRSKFLLKATARYYCSC